MTEKNLAYDLFDDENTIRKLQKSILESELFKVRNILNSYSPVNKNKMLEKIDGNSSQGNYEI